MGHAGTILGLNVCPPSNGWRNQSQHAIITGTDNSMALPLAVIAGAPAYLNGFAAIPLVRSLIDLGRPASTGLAFMLAGSVNSIPAAIAIFSLAKDGSLLFILRLAGPAPFWPG